MADPIWRKNYQNQLNLLEICYLGVFEVADYESDVKNSHFKMADTIWRAKLSKRSNLLELVVQVFSMSD